MMELTEKLQELVTRRGIREYDICRMARSRLTVEVCDSRLDSLKSASDFGVALRVIIDGRLGFSYSTNPDEAALTRIVDTAASAAGAVLPDPHYGFAFHPKDAFPGDLEIYDPNYADVSEDSLIEHALTLEAATLKFDPRVTKVERAGLVRQEIEMSLVNHAGLDCRGRSTLYSASVAAMAQEGGDSQMGWDFSFSNSWSDIDVETVGKEAARRAVELLGARPIGSMLAPVVLDNVTAASFLDVLSDCFLMEQVDKGKSMLKGRAGQEIFSSEINIVNDGLMARGAATFPFDGEGTPQKRVALVSEGVLDGYLYDNYYASKYNAESTGSSQRSSIKAPPSTGVSNIFIEPKESSFEDLQASIDEGLVVTDIMGIHTANRVSGDFSVGASGFLVSGGRRAKPVKGVMISGNIIELFSRAARVGNDLKFLGNVGAPSIYIERLNISGINE